MSPINFYPVKYFVEISEADLTGAINSINSINSINQINSIN
jgi:hypothetical protein